MTSPLILDYEHRLYLAQRQVATLRAENRWLRLALVALRRPDAQLPLTPAHDWQARGKAWHCARCGLDAGTPSLVGLPCERPRRKGGMHG